MITGNRKAKELYIRYTNQHKLDCSKRPTGRKMKRSRLACYVKMDKRLNRLRSGLNEYILDVVRLRMPKVRMSVPMCPMMRWK